MGARCSKLLYFITKVAFVDALTLRLFIWCDLETSLIQYAIEFLHKGGLKQRIDVSISDLNNPNLECQMVYRSVHEEAVIMKFEGSS